MANGTSAAVMAAVLTSILSPRRTSRWWSGTGRWVVEGLTAAGEALVYGRVDALPDQPWHRTGTARLSFAVSGLCVAMWAVTRLVTRSRYLQRLPVGAPATAARRAMAVRVVRSAVPFVSLVTFVKNLQTAASETALALHLHNRPDARTEYELHLVCASLNYFFFVANASVHIAFTGPWRRLTFDEVVRKGRYFAAVQIVVQILAHVLLRHHTDDPSTISAIESLFVAPCYCFCISNVLFTETYTEHILSTLGVTMSTIHAAPSKVGYSLALAAISLATAHVKLFLEAPETGLRADWRSDSSHDSSQSSSFDSQKLGPAVVEDTCAAAEDEERSEDARRSEAQASFANFTDSLRLCAFPLVIVNSELNVVMWNEAVCVATGIDL